MVAALVLFLLVLRVQTSADVNERSIRLLVEALGLERFDWHRAETLPEGPRLVTVSPAYNEAENVAAVIKWIPSEVDGYHVVPVVVSDGSHDRTAQVARDAGALVTELPDPPRRRPRAAGRLRDRAAARTPTSWSRSTRTASICPRRSPC